MKLPAAPFSGRVSDSVRLQGIKERPEFYRQPAEKCRHYYIQYGQLQPVAEHQRGVQPAADGNGPGRDRQNVSTVYGDDSNKNVGNGGEAYFLGDALDDRNGD